MRGQLSVPGSGKRLAIWRSPPPLALPAPPGHVPQLLVPPAPRRTRLGTVWAVFGAAVVGFLGASALIPAPREPSAGAVIGRSFVDGEGSWRFADTRMREFREALARLILPQPLAPPPAPPAPVVVQLTLPPDVRSIEPAAGRADSTGDDTTASLTRLAETLDRPAVDVGPFGEPLPPGDVAPAAQATWSGGVGATPEAALPSSLATPLESQLASLVASAGTSAAGVAGRTASTDQAESRQPAASRAARGAEPRLLAPAQPRRPAPPAEGAAARIIELPQLPEPRTVGVARAVPPPDGFATQVVATSASSVARQASGSAAWMRFARPFEPGDIRPRIALVVTDLGLSQGITDQAIHYLPGAVTLAFNPFADNLAKWVEQARRAGHEVLINLPLEAGNGPVRDTQVAANAAPGTASYPGAEAAGRLEWALNRTSGYVGVASFLGAGATGDDQVLRPILSVLRDRGFIYVGRQPGQRAASARLAQELGVPHAAIDRQIDADPSREAIEQRLAELEKTARDTGAAVAMVRAHPASFERLAIWHTSLETKGIALAPITAVLNRQRNR
jgi:polysaccharide deacetylase 2 family uncharacterized protein YibQ